MHIGSTAAGLVLQLRAPSLLRFFYRTKTLIIPWPLVARAEKAPGFSFVPQEMWVLGVERIPLTVPRGAVMLPG